MAHLWRAIDHYGDVLESYTKARDKSAALRFMRKTLKRHGKWENYRAENSHLPVRRRERAMLRFRQMKSLQKFASGYASLHNHSNSERHMVDRQTFKARRSAALAEWQLLAA